MDWYQGSLILEYLEPIPLNVPMPLDKFLRMAVDVSRAVAYLHDKGLIHNSITPKYERDFLFLRPSSSALDPCLTIFSVIFYSPEDGCYKLTGLNAATFGNSEKTSRDWDTKGNSPSPFSSLLSFLIFLCLEELLYRAPEHTGRVNRSVDVRCDIYSLGATFYRYITGKQW